MNSVIGVVGEFNPFHLGHFEHIRKSRRIAEPDAPVVCVMSGDFVQRGEAAIVNKHARAKMAVLCGAELVIELPLPWCCAAAAHFAMGAVGLLDSLGVVTHLSFGSECGNIEPLRILSDASLRRCNLGNIKSHLKAGVPFAEAREAVLRGVVGEAADLLQNPNNILGVEYIKALLMRGSDIIPITTLRTETVHDAVSDDERRSAGHLRQMLESGEDVRAYMPPAAYDVLAEELAAGRRVTMAALELAAMSRLRMMTQEDFCALPDATEGLGNRLYKAAWNHGCIADILAAVKTKRYPMSRLRRMVMCAVLGITNDTMPENVPYVRVLASTPQGRELLHRMKKTAAVPIITRPADAHRLEEPAKEIFELNARARDFYALGYATIDERAAGSDWKTSPATL